MIFMEVLSGLYNKEGIVGTNKLTRKEILSEDPVHETLVSLVDYFKNNGRMIGIIIAAVIVLLIGTYFGLQMLENRELKAQQQLGYGIELFHAQIAPDASNDPYSRGPIPVFKSETAKYEAAAKEFSSLASNYGNSKVKTIARYYLGLTQLHLGRKKEAIQNLESVAASSRNRDVSFFAKKVLAGDEAASKNYKRAAEILDGMIKDPKCPIPKEELGIELSHVLIAQGKRNEAIKVLSDLSVSNSQGPAFSSLKQQVAAELEKLQKGSN